MSQKCLNVTHRVLMLLHIHVHHTCPTVCEPIYVRTHIYTPHTCHIHKEKCSDSFEIFMQKLIFLYVVSKVYRWEAEEVGWCSRTLSALAEDQKTWSQFSVPTTGSSQPSLTPVPEDWMPSSVPWGRLHACSVHIYTQTSTCMRTHLK